jgi:phosphoenolpyruvate carboxylase
MVLSKSDVVIAAKYAALVPDREVGTVLFTHIRDA